MFKIQILDQQSPVKPLDAMVVVARRSRLEYVQTGLSPPNPHWYTAPAMTTRSKFLQRIWPGGAVIARIKPCIATAVAPIDVDILIRGHKLEACCIYVVCSLIAKMRTVTFGIVKVSKGGFSESLFVHMRHCGVDSGGGGRKSCR